ncbi:hypothetical protein [Streptomyces sp. AJS327]|uniref:hypothetical protein n=1 Tax=Streptomyces sp. AJS327 TaxID=2545265 RepID=UPI0027E46301|nr:hypothetical protein [Streptomyces sp. AJS327]
MLLVSMALAVPVVLGGAASAAELSTKAFHAKVKCAKVRISDNNAVGYVHGEGRAKTKPLAVAAAKKDANSKVGKGYRAKHCRSL